MENLIEIALPYLIGAILVVSICIICCIIHNRLLKNS